MNFSTLGDLSHSFLLRNRQADLHANMQNLQIELTTGRAHDTRTHLQGDFSHLTEIERTLSVLDGYKIATREAEITTRTMQTALDGIREATSDLTSDLIIATQSGTENALASAARSADQVFRAIVGHLNTTSAGRAVFSGSHVDSPALIDADTLLSQLRTVISGETTLAGIEQRIDDWFSQPGGGFDTIAYSGGTTDGAPFRLSEDTKVSVSLRADHEVFRELLGSVAKAALASGQERQLSSQMMQGALNGLVSGTGDLVDIQSGLGLSQEVIDETVARNEAAATALGIARNELLSVDQYETATALEQAQSQIETLYAITVRASRLSLLEFMR